ncbi:hypothetical protein KAT92_02600, partial [Candidatus Babeliales bacterium]|nr:hypothetical protein [Candidatus Babeliales bacterium]
GNILDLTNGGTLLVDSGSTLDLVDIVIKGVGGNAGEGSIIFADDSSKLNLVNSAIELVSNYSTTIGGIYVSGPAACLLGNNNWTFDQQASLTVDGMTLWKDPLDQDTCGELIFGTPEANYLTLLNSGTIKEMADAFLAILPSWVETTSDAVVAHEGRLDTAESFLITNSDAIVSLDDHLRFIHGPSDFTFSSNVTLTVDTFLSNDHVFTIGSNLIFDGDNHMMRFKKGDNGTLAVGGNSLTLQNIILKDFHPSAISTTTGSVTFGDGTTIEMSDNNSILSSNYTISCNGRVKLNCYGNELDISQMQHAIDILPSSTLEIYNARISGLGGANGNSYTNNLKCLAPDSTLTLTNCELMLEDNYSFTEGHLNIYQDVAIRGPEMPTSGSSLVFAYQSPQATTIHTVSKLMIDRYITFSYDSDSASKEKLVMEDKSAILHLNGCTLYSTRTGLVLETGRLQVEDKVSLRNEATIPEEAMVFKSDLDVDVLSGAIFDEVDGLFTYE